MSAGLVCAVGTSLCYGVGSVLQSAAAADAERVGALDPRLLLRLARGWRYPVGLALDGVGFFLSLVAVRTLPLYVVQAVMSSFLAVTAVVGVMVLGLRMRRHEVAALVVVVLGLVLVGLSAAPQSADVISTAASWLILGVAVLLVLGSVLMVRFSRGAGAGMLGGAAGLAFGVVAVAARALSASLTSDFGHDLNVLLQAPAFYALLITAPFGLTTYATALQRGTVVQATAPLVVGETVLPALAGLALFGDHARPGWGVLAVVGFLLAVGGSLVLSRYGEVEARAETSEASIR